MNWATHRRIGISRIMPRSVRITGGKGLRRDGSSRGSNRRVARARGTKFGIDVPPGCACEKIVELLSKFLLKKEDGVRLPKELVEPPTAIGDASSSPERRSQKVLGRAFNGFTEFVGSLLDRLDKSCCRPQSGDERFIRRFRGIAGGVSWRRRGASTALSFLGRGDPAARHALGADAM